MSYDPRDDYPEARFESSDLRMSSKVEEIADILVPFTSQGDWVEVAEDLYLLEVTEEDLERAVDGLEADAEYLFGAKWVMDWEVGAGEYTYYPDWLIGTFVDTGERFLFVSDNEYRKA